VYDHQINSREKIAQLNQTVTEKKAIIEAKRGVIWLALSLFPSLSFSLS